MNNDETRGREHFKITYYVLNRGIQLLVLRITSYNFEISSIGHSQKRTICIPWSFFLFFNFNITF